VAFDNSASSSSLRFCVCLTRAHKGIGVRVPSLPQLTSKQIYRGEAHGELHKGPFLTSYSSAQQSNLSFIYFTFWFY
jgi:hypothetical protein